MTFDLHKKNALSKLDKSKIGGIDEKIIPLVNLINSKEDYYTTSSCAGRIVLLAITESARKNEAEWLLQSHSAITFQQAKEALKNIPENKEVWFKEESTIIHVDCRTLEGAISFLHKAKDIGFRRSGISSIKHKIILEILSTERIDTIIAKEGKILVTDEYLQILVDEANKKLLKTQEKIEKFKNLLS